MLLWKPKALPMYCLGVESAIMASRGLPRTPFPRRSMKMSSRAKGQFVTNDSRGLAALETL